MVDLDGPSEQVDRCLEKAQLMVRVALLLWTLHERQYSPAKETRVANESEVIERISVCATSYV
jgi:hypothetical protein